MQVPQPSLPDCFDATLFDCEPLPPSFPGAVAVITAFATTGEVWSDERNRAADEALVSAIDAHGWPRHRVTGWAFDGDRLHAEPGWAVGCGRDEGREIGAQFHQRAVWWIENDRLELVSCESNEARWMDTGFRERLRKIGD